ncbi:DUF4153 domain-containing protein [Planosporangium mesophilum]|uniref:DUF4153 domain-containing protein n=1 Tax=Planosporangium mesophilum TaxID=689768 RepID=UPI0014391CDB|nr:DUF4173 domain-containing protein [Planosporangium mesophilum]NJC82326.1 DUF4173 domain-containing protein [Planosporangium mesophilum]
MLGAVLVAALVAAGTITLDRPGLGWLLTGTAVIAIVAAASVEFQVRPDVGRCLWAAAGIALLAAGTVRAAGWLFLLCLPVAALCAVQALAGAASVRAMVAGVVAAPVAVIRALPWAGRGARELSPRGRPDSVGRVLASVAVSAVLLVVFGALFASADDAFARVLARIVPDFDLGGAPRGLFLFVVVGLAGTGIAYLVAAPPRLAEPAEPSRPLRLVEWALPLTLLDALFALFVLVQVTVLFGGRDHVLRPGGPNFAQYARGGFWQLLLVTMLTLAVIGVVAWAAPRSRRRDRTAIRVLVGTLAALTLVIVASAITRMALYEQVYGYTRLRLLVSAVELWLGLLFVLVLVAGVRLRTRWLPRAVLASAVVGLLAFAAADPDRFIAGRNVDRYEHIGQVDLYYLSTLSPDAAPELARLPEGKRGCALQPISAQVREQRDAWYSYNAGRAAARAIPAPGPCTLP